MPRPIESPRRFDVLAVTLCVLVSLVLLALPDRVQVQVAHHLSAVVINPFQRVRNFGEDVLQVRAENAELAARLQVLELREAARRREAQDEARGATSVVLDPGLPGSIVPCQVLARERARYATMLQILAEERVAWRPGLAVIGPRGFLGRLHTLINDRAAWVELLTSPDMAVGVELERTGLLGVLRPRAGKFVIEMVGRDEDVQTGDRVITSGIAEVREEAGVPARDPVPRGLPVGVVRQVAAPADQVFKEITVQPLADFTRNEVVFVVGAIPLVRAAPDTTGRTGGRP